MVNLMVLEFSDFTKLYPKVQVLCNRAKMFFFFFFVYIMQKQTIANSGVPV